MERNRNTGHMSEPSAFVVPFVLGRDFYVAMIQVLLRQALTRALRAYLSFVTSVLDLETECRIPSAHEVPRVVSHDNIQQPYLSFLINEKIVEIPWNLLPWSCMSHQHQQLPVQFLHPMPSTPPVQSPMRHLLPCPSMLFSSYVRGNCLCGRVRHPCRLLTYTTPFFKTAQASIVFILWPRFRCVANLCGDISTAGAVCSASLFTPVHTFSLIVATENTT